MDVAFLAGPIRPLASFAVEGALVIHLFPGIEWWADAPTESYLDTKQARGFSDLDLEFAALEYPVVGISTQPVDSLRKWASRERVLHALASDSELQVAHALELPTVERARVHMYERLVLVVCEDRIKKVFHPVSQPEYIAAHVLTWLYRGSVAG